MFCSGFDGFFPVKVDAAVFFTFTIFILSKSHLAFYVCLTFGCCEVFFFFFSKRIMGKLKKDNLNRGFK